MAADPTLQFLADLRDPAKYRVTEAVPVFRPHTRTVTRADGKAETIVVTEADLATIAANCQALCDEGRPGLYFLGHRDPAKPESEQPPLAGYFLNYRVGTFGPKRVPCVLADRYTRADVPPETLAQYPLRSAEYYPPMKLITAVAGLKRDSALNLGAVAYQGGPLRYAWSPDMDGDKDLVKPAPGPDMANGEAGDPPGHDEWAKHMDHYAGKNPWVGYARQCYEAQGNGPAAPSATNSFIPGGGDKKKEPEAMQAAQVPVAYQQQVTALQAEVAQLKTERERAACERMVSALQAEGYKLDPAYEVRALLPLDAAGRAARCDYVRKHHEHRPVTGQGFVEVYQGPAEGVREAPVTQEMSMAAAAYAAAQPGDDWAKDRAYEDALARLRKGERL